MLSIGVMALVGCGGDSDTATSKAPVAETPPPPSKAEFIRQANVACEQARAGLAARVASFERRRAGRKPEPLADMVHFIFLPTVEAQVYGIEQVGVPSGQAKQVSDMLDAERDAIDRVAVVPRVASIATAEKQFGEPNRLFKAYDLNSCVIDDSR